MYLIAKTSTVIPHVVFLPFWQKLIVALLHCKFNLNTNVVKPHGFPKTCYLASLIIFMKSALEQNAFKTENCFVFLRVGDCIHASNFCHIYEQTLCRLQIEKGEPSIHPPEYRRDFSWRSMEGNITSLPPSTVSPNPPPSKSLDHALEVSFWVIAVASFTFNLSFCIVLLRKPSLLKKPHNILLFSLAVVDMLTGE